MIILLPCNTYYKRHKKTDRDGKVTTIRISDLNYRRLQLFAVPLEDTADKALGRVLDAAEAARQCGLVSDPMGKTTIGSVTDTNRLDFKLAARLDGIAVKAKEGDSMTRWEHRRTGARFWVTKRGAPRMYLPRRESYPSDTDRKVLYYSTPRSGWQRYDLFYLRDECDVEYALKILTDLDSP
jgi:hypothetical protein